MGFSLFGIDISLSSKKKEAERDKFLRLEEIVSREECHKAMDFLSQRFIDLKEHIDTRIDDLRDLINKTRR